ncbi:hypothetical protein FIV28_02950 [Lactiplantibacillus plantarum]|nr:hypothetical protein [Lactiplantibacillus plantarum]
MAQRRMFSNRITDSAKFLKMPLSSQALYFHLGLHADDGLKSIFETDFKRHSEPRLPSTAQINH